ncbi:hypothetical protein DY000_02027063 [Brassica cretica]|uniref:Uncharacterized protein n=1 Tax=Brassica cretica TaxID=69181 RepID=A0ABQ7EKG8_BRACR|nr:hypothetical protein DY000_02027063 [Brassica cretica]
MSLLATPEHGRVAVLSLALRTSKQPIASALSSGHFLWFTVSIRPLEQYFSLVIWFFLLAFSVHHHQYLALNLT